MTDEQAVRMLKAVRVYCQPEHRMAIERAIVLLNREKKTQGSKNVD